MKGANEYCNTFKKAEQVGRLYLLPSSHARGPTFHIYVLPEGVAVIENGGRNPPLNKNSVEVYGIIGGQPGWTESYGWLHDGKWQDDFNKLYEQRKAEIEKASKLNRKRQLEREQAAKNTTDDLLGSYT
jgi:hypothetical protein